MKRSLLLVGIAVALASCGSSEITVMTYNIYGARGLHRAEDYDALAAVINAQNPDFCVLNEVDSCTNRSRGTLNHEELAKRTGMNAFFAPAFIFDGGAYGNAILCKHPVKEKLHVYLPCDPSQDPKGGEVRSACFLKTEVDGFPFWMGGAHLDYREDESSRIWQANILRDYIAKMDGHLFFAGDMNAEPDSRTMETFSEYMQLNYMDKEQKTWPSKYIKEEPDVLIDYIMYRKPDKKVRLLSYEVINNTASDHCAVVARFKVRR